MINRQIHAGLEKKGIDSGKYTIEVSSPGIDRPMTLLREYKKNTGRKLIIRNVQNKYLKGLLVFVNSEKIILSNKDPKNKTENIAFTDIREARVTI